MSSHHTAQFFLLHYEQISNARIRRQERVIQRETGYRERWQTWRQWQRAVLGITLIWVGSTSLIALVNLWIYFLRSH